MYMERNERGALKFILYVKGDCYVSWKRKKEWLKVFGTGNELSCFHFLNNACNYQQAAINNKFECNSPVCLLKS